MDIYYLGHASFHLKGKDSSVVTDPFDPKAVGIRFPRVSATVVTVSHEHSDHNSSKLVGGVKKVISGPGEYEIEGVSIIGLPSFHDEKKGVERGKNTIYVYEIDKLRLCHLGDLGHKLDEATVTAIGEIDVLMIPVGGFYTIDGKLASEVTASIEPKIVIPMHYDLSGRGKNPLADEKAFIKELGIPEKREKKLSLKAGSLADEGLEVVVLDIA